MEEQLRQIAERIKGLRDVYGVTVEDVIRELGIDRQVYLEYESGEVDIPVGVLYQLARYFKLELSILITGEEPRLHTYALTRNGRGVVVERRREYKYQSLASHFAHKKAEPFLVTVPPDAPEAPVHCNSHPGQEFDYLLEGRLLVILGDREIVLDEGDSLFYDAGEAHGMKALDGRPAKFLAVIF